MATITTESSPIWANSTSSIFHPLTEWLDATGFSDVRASIELRQAPAASGGSELRVTAAYRYADDPYDTSTWSSAPGSAGTSLTTSATSTGSQPQYGSSYASVVSGQKRFIQFGVNTDNTAGTGQASLNLGFATVRIDYRD